MQVRTDVEDVLHRFYLDYVCTTAAESEHIERKTEDLFVACDRDMSYKSLAPSAASAIDRVLANVPHPQFSTTYASFALLIATARGSSRPSR